MCSTGRKDYLGSGVLLKKAIRKYGRENFKREILEICEDSESLKLAEVRWIEEFGAVESEDFYNLDVGGNGGGEPTSERVKMHWQSLSPEQRRERLNWFDWDRTGKNNSMWGRSRSKDVKETWNSRTLAERNAIRDKTMETKKERGVNCKGQNNPMYGRSIATEKKLRWYNLNGENGVYVPEGTQPEGYTPGRGKMKPRNKAQPCSATNN